MTSTWGSLQLGDRIVDKAGKQWRIYAAPEHGQAGHVVVGITDEGRYVPVNKPGDEVVETVDVDPEIARIEQVFEPDKVELLAVETLGEEAKRTGPGPRVYEPEDAMTTLKLRSHLYLIHNYATVGSLTNRMALLAHHKKCHELGEGIEHAHS
jgi:hypothetical protein